jgi:imidazolonepropionase
MEIRDRIAVITGGASGIGRALAQRFHADGARHIVIADRDEAGAQAMAEHGTTAVLLPGAYYFLRENQKPPIDLFRRHNVPMAVSTDSNPGSSPTTSLLLMLSMACTFFRLTPEEAINGITAAAASALGATPDHGTLTPGALANIAFFKITQPAELAYRIGHNPCVGRCYRGKIEFGE